MNKAQLLSQLSEQSGVTKKDAESVLEALTSVVSESLKSGDKVSIAGFGTFKVRENSARTGRNPQTGESIQIAASKSASFKPSKQLKDSLN
tara:strand:- start:869 stop:1141 length:273 start_codon:yes stop_codon:yes gene_type:complete